MSFRGWALPCPVLLQVKWKLRQRNKLIIEESGGKTSLHDPREKHKKSQPCPLWHTDLQKRLHLFCVSLRKVVDCSGKSVHPAVTMSRRFLSEERNPAEQEAGLRIQIFSKSCAHKMRQGLDTGSPLLEVFQRAITPA